MRDHCVVVFIQAHIYSPRWMMYLCSAASSVWLFLPPASLSAPADSYRLSCEWTSASSGRLGHSRSPGDGKILLLLSWPCNWIKKAQTKKKENIEGLRSLQTRSSSLDPVVDLCCISHFLSPTPLSLHTDLFIPAGKLQSKKQWTHHFTDGASLLGSLLSTGGAKLCVHEADLTRDGLSQHGQSCGVVALWWWKKTGHENRFQALKHKPKRLTFRLESFKYNV